MSGWKQKSKRGFASRIVPVVPEEPCGNLCKEESFLLSSNQLFESIVKLHSSCPPSCIRLTNPAEHKSGHLSAVRVECTKCKLDFFLSDPSRDKTTFREGKQLNKTVNLAANVVGLDETGVKKLCAVIGVDGPHSYHELYQDELHNKLSSIVDKRLEENRKFARSSRDAGDSTESIQIGVKCDGTYQKRGDRSRGYTSKISVTVIFDADTDLPLDYEVESKFCHTCSQSKCTNEDDFAEWFVNNPHECQNTIDVPSSEMERASMKKMFQRSLKHNLKYKYLVSDGDCKSYNDVWDTYSLCEHCNKHKKKLMDPSGDEYKTWAQTEDFEKWKENHADISYDCDIVVKVDCVSHVSKNFAKKIEELGKSGKKLENKSINRGNHCLGKISRVKLQKNFRNAIKRTVRPNVRDLAELKEACRSMRREIMAVLHHSCDLEPEERHKYCPHNSWCLYNTDNPDAFEHRSHHLRREIYEHLLPIFESYTQDSCLSKMVLGYTTNLNEAYNSVLWSMIGKSKFHGKKHQEIAVMLSLLQYQDGFSSTLKIMKEMEIPITKYASKLFNDLDKQRKRSRAYKKLQEKKRYQSWLSSALEQKRVKCPGYSAGCQDQSDVASSAIPSSNLSSANEKKKYHEGEFVIIPYGPKFYIGQIKKVDDKTEEFQTQTMHKVSRTEYRWKEEGESEFELPWWEDCSSILLLVNPPTVASNYGSTRLTFTFSEADIDAAEEAYANWRSSREVTRKRRKLC